jgi:hypothetical protein
LINKVCPWNRTVFRIRSNTSNHALIALDTVFDKANVAEEAGNVERKEAGDSITSCRVDDRGSAFMRFFKK